MVQIGKTIQAKHLETLSPWLKDFAATAGTIALPLLPRHLAEFPTRWPFPRGDLYHWIVLLNRFDLILELFIKTYELKDGPQRVEFGRKVLESTKKTTPDTLELLHGESSESQDLNSLGFGKDGDRQLIESILNFSRMLLENCGNRSLYGSSSYLDSLLNTTSLSLLESTLLLSSQLAQRYSTAAKRGPARLNQAVLNSHYSIDLNKVQQLAQPFSKTVVIPAESAQPTTPVTPSAKGKEKAYFSTPVTGQKGSTTTVYANDVVSLAKGGVINASGPKTMRSRGTKASVQAFNTGWETWGDVRLSYYPKISAESEANNTPRPSAITPSNNVPTTPTPIRRASNLGPHGQRANRISSVDESPAPASRSSNSNADEAPISTVKTVDISVSEIKAVGLHALLRKYCAGLPSEQQYELLTKLRAADALTTSLETRRHLLSVRLLAITNMAYIHSESAFAENILKQDSDEPRRLQLIPQLAELIHPPAESEDAVPRHIQTLALSTLTAIAVQHTGGTKFQDVCSALNANVNHGVLLYVIRKAVAEMSDNESVDEIEQDDWRDALFELIFNIALVPRTATDLVTAGVIPIFVEVLSLRNPVAERYYPKIISFLDNLVYSVREAFQVLVDAGGLDVVSSLVVDQVKTASKLAESSEGIQPEYKSPSLDYEIRYYQQQTLKWVFKFIHHMMTSSGAHGGNSERLLRNLVDSSQLLGSLKQVIQNSRIFGSVVWTNAIMILNDFINNEPTSFTIILEAGLSKAVLEAVTGRPVTIPSDSKVKELEEERNPDASSPASSEDTPTINVDTTPHPPTQESLQIARSGPLAQGIMPSTDAILILPQAFNAMCLSADGMKLFLASKALDSFFEIFESPDHVKCLSSNMLNSSSSSVTSQLGASFDELVRHHPKLKTFIVNAVLDMVARVAYLCKTTAEGGKIGARLLAHLPTAADAKGKGKAVEEATDVEMMDIDSEPEGISPLAQAETPDKNSMTPYIAVVAQFLHTLLSNTSVATEFSTRGGVEYLLDFADSPCLPCAFVQSQITNSTSNTLNICIAELADKKPHLVIPSLLKRAQVAADTIAPFAKKSGNESFFKQFVIPKDLNTVTRDQCAQGTKIVKALVAIDSVVTILQRALKSDFGVPRSFTTNFHTLNFNDYYARLVRSLGDLLGASVSEGLLLEQIIPQHWNEKEDRSSTGPSLEAIPETEPTSPAIDAVAIENEQTGTLDRASKPASQEKKKMTKEEKDSVYYKNYQTLKYLLGHMSKAISPFFQTLGKVLISKRNQGAFQRQSQTEIAVALAETLLHLLNDQPQERSVEQLKYWHAILKVLSKTLVDHPGHADRPPVQTITLVLQAFKDRGGFDTVNHIIEVCSKEIESSTNDEDSIRSTSIEILNHVLPVYTHVVSGKAVTEASQSALLGSGRQVADKAKSDYFSPQQFLVELRMAVFPAIRHLWEASPVDKTPSSTWSTLISVIRATAQADHELGANKRSEKIGPTVQASRDYFKPNADHLISLLDDAEGDEELVKEALYRCANNIAPAREYIKDMRADRNSGRNPIPPSDVAAEVPSNPRPRTSTSAATSTPDFTDQEMEVNSLPELDLSRPMTSDQQAERERIVQSFAASQQAPIAPEDPKIKRVTVEDLDEERSSIRENLVDRCLEIIYRHGEVTFDVADLLTTFVGKVHDQMDFRREIGTSVMAVLQSYETLEDISDKGKEVAAAAHLLGLMLQDKPFYEATVELLRESIPTMLTYIKLSPSHSAMNPSPWISQVLLIIETLLRTDERPRKTKFKMPKSEQDTIDTPVLEKKEFTISREERLQLLESILEILPRVGMAKDEVLALAVLRILVILTRDRPVAQTMGEKKNIQRLFAMAKQLAGSSSARIHGQLMLILRHIIEDEETIKQIMRSEIKAVFESHRHPRNVDVTNYLRTLSAQALRAPELFIEVTNEMVKFGRWTYPASDVPSRPNYLVLKEVDSTEKSVDDSVQPTVQATEDLSIQDVKPSTEGEDSEMGEASKLPAPEQKAPAVENPDGVIHFLLCELLNYRDVEDLDPSIAANATAEKTAATTSTTDTDMSGTSTTDTLLKKDEKSSKVPGKQDFKSEEHPIYIYRCFILQCLTELLSSYNRTKIEFINFKRSAPQLAMTPSKPRSSVINYLLSDLIPVGTLEHAETTALRKRFTTSSWADSVLTALLSKTGEQPVDKARELSDGDDEPDLQFVRRFVLENILRAFKEASASSEPLEVKYARMLSLADLMGHIMSGKGTEDRHSHDALTSRNHAQLRRLMFEKGYIAALTSSIAEIDLNFPNAKRAVKYILRPLKTLTHTAQTLSELGLISTPPGDGDVDDIESATSVSDVDDDREETPDLFRNSTLGMFEAGGEEESSSSDDDDEEMYEGEYDEEGMDYDEEMEEDDEDNISDEDEDFEGMGPIEGLDGDHAMDIEVTMDEADDIESAGSDEEEEDDDDDDEEDSDDDDARVEIIDELGNVHDAGDEDDEAEEWESDDEEEDYEGQAADQEEARAHMDDMQNSPLGHLVRALGGDDHEGAVEILQRMEDEGLDEGEQLGEYLEDVEDEDEEDEEDDMVDEEMLFDSFPDGPPPFAWDEADPPMVIGHRRPRGLQSLPIFHGGPRDPLGGMSHSPTSPLGFEDPILARRLEAAVDNLRSASSRLRAVVDRIVGLRLNSQVFLESQHQSILDNIMSHVTNDDEANPHSVVPDYRSTYRSHRPGQPPRSADDGTNPLLQRANSSGTSSHAAARAYPGGWVAPAGLDLLDIGLGGRHSYGASPAALLNDLIRTLPMPGTITRGGQALQFHITGHGEMPRDLQAMFGIARGYRSENRRDNVDPGSATSCNPQSTTARWTEEAKILFGSQHHEVTADITMALNAVLVPPAIEADKAFKAAEAERIRKAEEEAKKRAEEERIAKEAKEAEERIAREKKEAEEREAAEKAAAESAAARGLESDQNESGEPVVTETETDAMDTTSDAGPSGDGEEAPASDRPRVTTQIRGQSFDITDLGIDADFLAELPEELREEVIMSAVAERRSQAAATGAQPSDIDQDFLDALPDDIRDEIIQQERQDRRRRERDEQRRQAAANGGRDPALDMDPASILATLPPALRQQVLMEQDEDMINQLPPDLAAQARAFQREDRIHQGRVPMAARRTGGPAVPEATGQRPVRRPVVQMLDKPGVATLLRLMFVLQQGTLRSALNSVLQYVSNNKQNRSDVISTLLHILQDGSADMSAVERSFAHLSLKAKQPKDKDPKTPTTLKRTLTSTSTSGVLAAPTAQINSEASPLMVVQQCLHVLTHLSQFNPHVPSFFLTEHGNVAAGLKRTLSRKGKGKESEATKYALNSLLCLLDRDLIMESSTVMESLSALLNMTTQPLPALDRKQKEAAEEAKKARENATADSQAVPGEPVAQSAEIAQTNESASGPTASVEESAQPDESAANTETIPAVETAKDADKKIRPFTPPVVPDYNLKLVINIFVARECSRKTFQETISTIKNLSVIPGAKSVFGRELITKAQELGEVILGDLQQLLPQIQKATTSTEIQGLALAKFSPTSSDQNKLLRVLTALDHLFDPKLNKDKNTSQDDGESAEKQDLLSSLYENSTFGPMWGKLSACLSAIRQREHMLNVATILLPLIESLMVVCKNTTLKDAPISRSQLGKEMMLTSPPPESRMESLFFTFTEEHRKILNDLVRQNPKLMSGTFSLLVKNPKVLEFDNKRNYFGRSIRERNPQARQSYPPLQLSVRRDQVFHDSFKSLYFQTGDQMKYGKLSIRFHGEEGVDAGGVTREWFQVLSRQMFEPGYALFIPVSSDRTTFHPNQLSSINEEHLMFFKFIGRIIGKALYENRVLDCHFSRAVYKAILGKQISLKDMESLDPEYYKSLVWMLENDITDIITETFSVDNDKFGVIETIDFIPNGRNTPVTEENKHEYVRLMVEFKLTGSVKAQLDEFLKGFHEIIPAELVAIFNEQELELLISGLPEIDVDDWKSNTEYHNYSGASPQIQWFWRAVRSYDKEERAKLLQFVTGTSKVPLNGFKELEGMNGFSRFNIHRDYGNKDRLPSSHTCFNQLDLPEYESYDVLRQQVLTAITAGSEYFGFA